MRKKGGVQKYTGHKRDTAIFLVVLLCVYIAIFLFISIKTGIYKIDTQTNNDRFFSADDIYYSTKIYSAEMDTSARIVKHPLLIPAASLLSRLEHAFFGELSYYSHYRIIIIFQILCFFISIIYLYKILREHFSLSGVKIYLILLIYALAPPTLIYTFVIESYIISSMILIMAYYYILKGSTPASVILGICAAGITITNAFIWALMLILSKMSVTKKIISLIGAAAAFFIIMYLTPAGAIFYDNLTSVFISSPKNYRDSFGLAEASRRTVFLFFANTFFCMDTAEQSPFGEFPGNAISFLPSADMLVVIMMCLWILILLYSIINNRGDRSVIIAAAVLLFNILLHGVLQYGLKEGFLFSLHHLYAQLLIAAAALSSGSENMRRCVTAVISVFIIAFIGLNLQGFMNILAFAERF